MTSILWRATAGPSPFRMQLGGLGGRIISKDSPRTGASFPALNCEPVLSGHGGRHLRAYINGAVLQKGRRSAVAIKAIPSELGVKQDYPGTARFDPGTTLRKLRIRRCGLAFYTDGLLGRATAYGSN